MVEDRNLFRDSSSPNLTSVSLEVILGAKNKQKGSGEVITEVITSKTQGNSWVISQQVLFFNAFKLGTRSKKNQVFSNDEATFLFFPFLPFFFSLGKIWLLTGGEKCIMPFPTSITAPRCFSRDLPSVICPLPTYSITR